MMFQKIRKKIITPLFWGVINSFQFKDPRILFSCVITRKMPKSTKLPHPVGIVIGKSNGVRIGESCTIMQNVTIGVKKLGDVAGPSIGDNVFIGASSVIVGNIVIGDNVIIGAGSFVDYDVPENSKVIGIKSTIYSPRGK